MASSSELAPLDLAASFQDLERVSNLEAKESPEKVMEVAHSFFGSMTTRVISSELSCRTALHLLPTTLTQSEIRSLPAIFKALGWIKEADMTSLIELAVKNHHYSLAKSLYEFTDEEEPLAPVQADVRFEDIKSVGTAIDAGAFGLVPKFLAQGRYSPAALHEYGFYWIVEALHARFPEAAAAILSYIVLDKDKIVELAKLAIENHLPKFGLLIAEKAIKFKLLNVLEMLGARQSLDGKLPSGSTLLHRCVDKKFVEGIEYLISIKVNQMEVDFQGKTPAMLALERKLPNAHKLFQLDPTTVAFKEIEVDPSHYDALSWNRSFGHINSLKNTETREFEFISLPCLFENIQHLKPFKELDENIQEQIGEMAACHVRPDSDYTRVAEKIKNKELVMLTVCPVGHVFYLVFGQGFVAISDRQARVDESSKNFRVYKIRNYPENLAYLCHLVHDMRVTVPETYRAVGRFLKSFDPVRDEETAILESISLEKQQVDNCVFANLKGAIRMAFAFNKLGTGFSLPQAAAVARVKAKNWSTVMRLASIEEMIKLEGYDLMAVMDALEKVRKRPGVLKQAKNYGPQMLELLKAQNADKVVEILSLV